MFYDDAAIAEVGFWKIDHLLVTFQMHRWFPSTSFTLPFTSTLLPTQKACHGHIGLDFFRVGRI